MAEYINSRDMDAHYTVFFNILSCLTYQMTIITIFLEQHKLQDLIKEEKVMECNVDHEFGAAREWLMYELTAYYM